MKRFDIEENGLFLTLEVLDNGRVRLINFSPFPYQEGDVAKSLINGAKLVELQESGCNNADHHGMRHTGSLPGSWMTFVNLKDYRNEKGRKLEIKQQYEGLQVTSHIQFYNQIKAIRSWTELENASAEDRHIEYVSSFCYFLTSTRGERHWPQKMRIHMAHNSWYNEARWQTYTLPQLGMNPIDMLATTKRIYAQSVGTWSTEEYLPMGCLENQDSNETWVWQIENNGSWYWEVGDSAGDCIQNPGDTELMISTEGTDGAQVYFELSGPTEQDSQWHKVLHPGDKFISVPVAVSAVNGSFEDAVDELVQYRRQIRRPNKDNEMLGVIFNDYMNCLFGDSTTEKLLPLIDAAADAGCEYFCIDCGWYADGNWWGSVGEWNPSEKRYPGGIQKPIQYIRDKGMIPGIWLEVEVMGTACPLTSKVPKDWFFTRHGKPVCDTCRYQLDFRNPEVREHATRTVKKLVEDFGVGYIKMDYNINGGPGTELNSDSLGDGLLEHTRAYLKWLDGIFETYPDLIIENCGSGGMRMDYAMLSRHSIQSSSDQTDYMKNAAIAASSAAGVNPEQCAIWSYPLAAADREEVAVNMINALLLRIHQSGHLANLSEESFNLVKEGIAVYKEIRQDLKNGLPFWPTGMASFYDDWFSFGLKCGNKRYLAVWHKDGENSIVLPVKDLENASIKTIYPSFSTDTAEIVENGIKVTMNSKKSARLFEITNH